MAAKRFLDDHQIVSIVPPIDIDTDQVTTGTIGTNGCDYVSLKNYGRAVFIFHKGVGTAGDDFVLDFKQASDVAGTGVKDLDVVATYWIKTAATNLAAVGTFTEITQTAASEIFTNAAAGASMVLLVVEIRSDQLDVANGFDCVSVNVSLDASGGAALATVITILCDPRFPQSPATQVSAIVD